LVNFVCPAPPPPALTPKEKQEAKAAGKVRDEQKAKQAEEMTEAEQERERAERRARQAKQAEYIAEHP
jgi:hypothetical protein